MRANTGLNRGQKSISVTWPAPVGGWNARDSIANMPGSDASLMINWFPTTSDLTLRGGYTNYATGLGGQVNTLMAYNTGSLSKMFAARGANIYDVTNIGAVGAAVVTGLTSDKFSHINITTPGGTFLSIVNGADAYRTYDGTTWATPAITGVAGASLNFVTLTKNRLWFVEKASTRAWYLPIQSISGTANQLDMGTVFRRGGYLVAIGSWSNTGGFGAQDLTCFISSEGELAIYQGIDPSQTGGWNLVGLYYVGAPLGNRCFAKMGTDLLIITKEGLIGLSQGQFFADVSGQKSSLTNKIQWAISAATSNYAVNFGWQIQVYPLQNMLILNVPVGFGQQQQYVMNTISGSWTAFNGLYANCWEVLNDQLYFGANGITGKALNGFSDNGANIQGDVITAFSNFGSPAQLKQFMMARPIITAGALTQVSLGICIDYNTGVVAPSISGAAISASVWNTAIWNSSYWVSQSFLTGDWVTLNGYGYNAALRVTASSSNQLRFSATDILFQRGRTL